MVADDRETGGDAQYTVLVNAEEQYSLWPAFLPLPEGWQCIGFKGSQDECMRHVDEIWTDMRPLSLRREL